MIGTLGTTKWIQLNLDENYGADFQSFDGGLIGLNNFGSKSNATSYIDEADYYCKLKYRSENYKAWCNMFDDLKKASGVYILFEVIGIVTILAWAASLIAFIMKYGCFLCAFWCSCCAWISHYIAFIGYFYFSSVDFNDSCHKVSNSNKSPNLCAKDGPSLSLFTSILLPLTVIAFYWIGCIARKKLTKRERQEKIMNDQVKCNDEFVIKIPNSDFQLVEHINPSKIPQKNYEGISPFAEEKSHDGTVLDEYSDLSNKV